MRDLRRRWLSLRPEGFLALRCLSGDRNDGPNCANIYVAADGDSDESRLWFVDPTTDSWANLIHRPGADTYPIHQFGPRNLWDEIEAAYQWWCEVGRPGPDRWRITITPQDQHVTLTPAGAHPAPGATEAGHASGTRKE